MIQRYVPIDKSLVPYRFRIRLAGETYEFAIRYNVEGDFFTVDLWTGDELLVVGEKMIYAKPLFSTYSDDRFPSPMLTPLDFAEGAERAGWDELGKSVFLYIFTEEDFADVS